jgi:hypothetical protein
MQNVAWINSSLEDTLHQQFSSTTVFHYLERKNFRGKTPWYKKNPSQALVFKEKAFFL